MIKDEQWPVARLIPISSASGIEAQERRAASALLAVLSVVDEFGKALLRPLGAPAGRIETFIEIPFKVDGRSIRPDGIITVSRGGTTWGALVEVKTGSNQLEADQIDVYLDLARELQFDAVLTISNQYSTSSSEYPLPVDRRKTKKVRIHHWSWVQVLTEAVVQKQHRGVKDPDQAYILNELIRYLSDPRSGAVAFQDMGPGWTTVRDGARERTLRRADPQVEAISYRWDELIRYLCLDLTKDLGRDVEHVVSANERATNARLQALRDSLVERGELHAEIRIPGAASTLEIVANLSSRQITSSCKIDAPREGRSKGRISWLVRQLSNAPEQLKVEARVARSSSSLASSLETVREDPMLLVPEATKEIRQFVLSVTKDMGLKRDAGRGSFIYTVLNTVKDFYGNVLQNLRPWKAQPPKLVPRPEEPVAREIEVELPEKVVKGIEDAEREMEEKAGEVATVNGEAKSPPTPS